MSHNAGDLIVTARPGATSGTLNAFGKSYPCALGRSGIVAEKREGDGGTPLGRWPIRELRYRADRITGLRTGLSAQPIEADQGWCDAADDPAYNRQVRLPYAAAHEKLWRDDHLYDLVVVLGYNDAPVVPGAGSAIFFHLARPAGDGFAPTEGCVAVARDDMLEILRQLTSDHFIRIRISD